MSRTYLQAAGLTAVGFLAAGLSQESKARALFESLLYRRSTLRCWPNPSAEPSGN